MMLKNAGNEKFFARLPFKRVRLTKKAEPRGNYDYEKPETFSDNGQA